MTKKRVTKKAATPSEDKEHVVVVDLNVEDILPDEDNPNEMDEVTFDQLVEEIREQGFDEPVLVRPHPKLKGKYQMGSGHHRLKAAIVIGMKTVPSIIKNWTDRQQKVALSKRNALRGAPNKQRLLKLYRDLAKGHDPVQVQKELGYVDQKKFEKMIDVAKENLPPKAKKKLEAAREKIKSVDDLSSVLNTIFKESGSELDHGYMVFSFGGKNHHYFQIGSETEAILQSIITECEDKGVPYTEAIKSLIHAPLDLTKLPKTEKPATKEDGKKKTIRKKKKLPKKG